MSIKNKKQSKTSFRRFQTGYKMNFIYSTPNINVYIKIANPKISRMTVKLK